MTIALHWWYGPIALVVVAYLLCLIAAGDKQPPYAMLPPVKFLVALALLCIALGWLVGGCVR